MFVQQNFILFLTVAIVSAKNIIWNGNSATKCDFSAKDDFSLVKSPVQECRGLCTSTYGCTHYVWSLFPGDGTCFLKHDPYVSKGDAFTTDVESAVCGIVATAVNWNGENWAVRCDFPSVDDFQSVPSIKEECMRICSTTDRCTHFTWSLNAGGTCFLKHNIDITKNMAFKSNSKSAICGIVNQSTVS